LAYFLSDQYNNHPHHHHLGYHFQHKTYDVAERGVPDHNFVTLENKLGYDGSG
jgi:hypothetical protein